MNEADITAFAGAMAGTYRVFTTDIADYRFLYRGYWYDKHLGIYHVRHRAYDPALQRWLQPDPAGFIDGLNLYAYCGNEPFGLYDPMGLEAQWHHLLPQAVFRDDGYIRTIGIVIDGATEGWIDAARYGHIMDRADHVGAGGPKKIHDAYSDAWRGWLDKQGGHTSVAAIEKQLEVFRNDPQFQEWLGKGGPAVHSHSEWNDRKLNLDKDAELKAAKSRASAGKSAKGAVKRFAGAAGRKLPLVGLLFIAIDLATGASVQEAAANAILPVPLDDIKDAQESGQQAVDEWVDEGRDNVNERLMRNAGLCDSEESGS